MHESYIKLFTEIAHTTEVLAERVMDYNHKKNDAEGEENAKIMRDDYVALYGKLRSDDFKPDMLTRAEYAKLLVGVMIIVNNIEDRIKSEQKAIDGYKLDVIPKLQRVVNETKDDETAYSVAEHVFAIQEEEKSES